jgi:hypothetical protein
VQLGNLLRTFHLTKISRIVHAHAATLITHPMRGTSMPGNPMNPQPPIAEPGKGLPQREIENPGHSHPEREADPEPLQPDRDDDLF